MVAKNRLEANQSLKGGFAGGIVGGIVLAVILLILMVANGMDGWVALKGASAPFFHERAHLPGFDFAPVVVGVLCHFLVSVVWGLVFGLLVYGFSKGSTIALGVPFGIAVWIGMHYIVLPILGLPSGGQPPEQAIVLHVIFGLAVAVGFLPYQSDLPHRVDHDRRTGELPPIERPV